MYGKNGAPKNDLSISFFEAMLLERKYLKRNNEGKKMARLNFLDYLFF